MKKRRHHHVWQYYLKSWATNDQIFCLREGRIFQTNTLNIAQDRDFYKIPKLTDDDIAWARRLVTSKSNPLAKTLHEDFLAKILAPMNFLERMKSYLTKDKELDGEIDLYRTNVLEDFHANIEAHFIPLLNRIRTHDINFYESENDCITFLHFICVQIMRTKAVRERSLELNRKNASAVDISRIWNLLTYMLAVNVAGGLYLERKRRKLVLIKNNTEVNFVTSDQPATNLFGSGTKPPETLSIYYPISPNLALILSEEEKEPLYSTETLTSEQVATLNDRIVAVSHSQIFGHSEASLRELKVK